MPKTVKYIGTQVRWPELATTGKQSAWMPGQQDQRSDAEAAQLLSTGLFSDVDATELTLAQIASVAKLIYRRAGNLTTGTGADLVFSGAGGAGAGKLNTGVDLLIPAGTLVAGQSLLKFVAHVRRTGTDASFLDVRFGATNGTSDGVMVSAAQFSAAVNPGDIHIDIVASATASRLTSTNQVSIINAAGTGVTITDLASLNYAVDNYVSVVVAGCTTGSYRVVSYELQVFQ